jgi:hypothetical protein
VEGSGLLLLDKTVWHFRRYCQFFSRQVDNIDGSQVDSFKAQLKSVHAARYQKRPNTFEISGGLERMNNGIGLGAAINSRLSSDPFSSRIFSITPPKSKGEDEKEEFN